MTFGEFYAVCTTAPVSTDAHHISINENVAGRQFPHLDRDRLPGLEEADSIAPMNTFCRSVIHKFGQMYRRIP